MKREFTRPDRLGSQIANAMATLIQQEVSSKEVGMVTVTDAKLSKDLSHAKVFVSFLGVPQGKESDSLRYLNDMAPLFRSRLGKLIHARVTPEIRFFHDDSLSRGEAMDDLFRKINRSDDPDA